MPKSFLVKKKKPRRAEDGEAVEPVEAVRSEDTNTDEELSLAEEMEVETVEILDEEGDHNKESLLSKDIEQEMATSVCKFDGERDSFAVQPVEKRDAKLERSSGCNDICWWSSITSRYELQNLPPPPKLISSVPRNGFSKMHHSHPTEHERSVISLNQRHHFPLTANGFGVMNFHEHRVPSIAESIPVRGSLDGLRELSLNLRHVSEGRRDSPLCPSVPQPSPAPQFNGSHFFIHSHPFLTSHQQQECLTNLQNKEQARKGSESEETKYKCEICNSSFTLQRLLNRHMKTHSFYKRYHCQFCTKGFNDTFDLKRHIRTHTGIKPFKCSRCDKSFTQRCSLEAHLTRVHGVVHKFGFRERRSKLFVCEDCGSTFTENSDFMKHLHEFHPETEKIMRARRNGGFVPKLKGDC